MIHEQITHQPEGCFFSIISTKDWMVGSHKLNNTSSRLCEQPTVALPLLSAGILSAGLLFHAQTRHHRLAWTEKTGEDEAGGSLQAAMSRWDLFPPTTKGISHGARASSGHPATLVHSAKETRGWCANPQTSPEKDDYSCSYRLTALCSSLHSASLTMATGDTDNKGRDKRRLLIKEK